MPGTDTRLRLTYPEALPITAQREIVLDAIRDNQVVVVAGETGSGKSTQLPKLCLELGRGREGFIGHTQPRRLAARTVAARIAEELDTEIGGLVGYKVRFSDQVGDTTMVKLMTDGILLAELRRDPELRRYDTLIVDEAHERSLNIDFLLGYLTELLPRRPDLKVIVTSATIDTERFAAHFGAPVVEVSGRTYPVDVRYRPIGEGGPDPAARGVDQVDAIRLAVDELRREGPGDILVFLSGQREIHDTARALTELDLPDTEILPLYARLSAAEQQRAFRPHRGRRIVLATNVAETSITVPGVRYVVDTGTARISRYNRRTKLQRLPIEPVSQASADQRSGRCGRVAPGIAIRLYGEDDFAERPEFTEPEILRTNLASVILQMAELGLGDVEKFPFIDPPDSRAVRDAIALLVELHALTASGGLTLTPDGRRMARLPVDPRFGRMLLTAEADGCLREVTVIVAALSIQDPRERPTGEEQAADEMHARFKVPGSDFLAHMALWEHLASEQRSRSSSAFRRMCRAEHLNHVRVREWQDLVRQLREAAHELKMRRNDRPAEPDAIHRSLLAGLLSHIGTWDRNARDYRGARQARFSVASRSVMARSSASWVMAGELVETGRLWARMVARIDPSWIEPLAGHLVKRSYGEPRWSRRRGMAVTDEQVTLYGLPIVAGRPVPLERVDAVLARAMFVDHALVEGDWDGPGRSTPAFVAANRALLDDARGLEARIRRADLVVDETRLADLYDARVPGDVASSRAFGRWWKEASRRSPSADLLAFTLDDLLGMDAASVDTAGFPLTWAPVGGGPALDLSYVFEPGADDDGVTVHVPLAVLPQVSAAGVDWHVPGHRPELVTALIRTLPKALRRELSPAPERAAEALEAIGPGDGPLLEVLARRLRSLAGVRVVAGDFDVARLPRHLQLRFSVEDASGRVVAAGRDLPSLSASLGERARRAVAAVTPGHLERAGLRAWPGGDLPRRVETALPGAGAGAGAGAGGTAADGGAGDGGTAADGGAGAGGASGAGADGGDGGASAAVVAIAYPALVDEGDTVAVRITTTPADQERAMWAATRRLLLLAAPAARAQAESRLRAAAPRARSSDAAASSSKGRRHASGAAASSSKARRGASLSSLSDLGRLASATSPTAPPGRPPDAEAVRAVALVVDVPTALATLPGFGRGAGAETGAGNKAVADLAGDCVAAALDRLLAARGGPAWDEEGHRRLEEAARDRLTPLAVAAAGEAADILTAAADVADRLRQLGRLGAAAPALEPAVADMEAQLVRLVHPGFVSVAGLTRLQHVGRYVEALRIRLDKLRERPDRDRELMARAHSVEAEHDAVVAALPPSRRADPDVVDAGWMLDELRVSLFAQVLGTAQPVSEQRVRRTLAALTP